MRDQRATGRGRQGGRDGRVTLNDGTVHGLAASAQAARGIALAGQAIQALASGSGHSGHHLRILLLVVAVIVVGAVAWIVIAGRARRNRGQR